jgi:Tfp pilus assembly protein PilX
MRPTKKSIRRRRRAAVLIVSMIFVILFSVFAATMATISGINVQVADNQRKIDAARACAESGLEIMRHWLSQVSISGNITPDQRLTLVNNALPTNLQDDTYNSTIETPSVTLNSAKNQSFVATITQIDDDTLQMDVTGIYGSITRTIRVNYIFETSANTVFDYGVASKGAVSLTGNVELAGVNLAVESNVYIESSDSLLALSLQGNSQIAGDVSIVNPLAYVYLQGGNAGIGGETGQDAIDNHVDFGVPPAEFPEPDTGYFEPYVTNIVDCNTDTSSDVTFENVRILANTYPNFSGHVTLKGVVFVETPNIVNFTGNVDVMAIIIGDGDLTDNSGTNQINFCGNVESLPVSELPDEEQFAGLHDKTGTFIVAPGFSLSFGGNFTTQSGAIAGNGIEFFGNAGGIINGSIINYSNEELTITGNSDLYFNRSGTVEVPAGFVPQIILEYDPSSYSEICSSSS